MRKWSCCSARHGAEFRNKIAGIFGCFVGVQIACGDILKSLKSAKLRNCLVAVICGAYPEDCGASASNIPCRDRRTSACRKLRTAPNASCGLHRTQAHITQQDLVPEVMTVSEMAVFRLVHNRTDRDPFLPHRGFSPSLFSNNRS